MDEGDSRAPSSPYWLLVSSVAARGARMRAFTLVPSGGERTLVVFSSEERAEAFLSAEAPEGGWRPWETRAGELLSVLFTSRFSTGPCADVRRVALDPPPEPAFSAGECGSTVSRRDFMEHLMGRKSLAGGPGHEPDPDHRARHDSALLGGVVSGRPDRASGELQV